MISRRAHLLDAAAQLFARHGLRKTSIEDITRGAGVSKGSFYLEFLNKDDLFDELVREAFIAYLRDAEERITTNPNGGRLSPLHRASN
ncbi:MAG: helix-turn-helix domain-containing protein [Tessaracoccus sp.]